MKNMFFLVLLSIANGAIGQNNTQTIRGTVNDKLSQSPLAGVSFQIISLQRGTKSDSLGKFSLSDLPPDRYEIIISYMGYKSLTIPDVVVSSGKEVILDVAMEETFPTLKEIIIKSNNKSGTINKMASISARTFSMEEVNRYAGGRSDPARLAANFAGVSAPDDSRNDIVIRGNSPVGVLWRIEGMNVTNPNHFASVGTTGGAVSALNTNVLKNSDFFTSAFPAEYGNATAGVFDLSFRNGNNKKRETTVQLGVITGLEATTEGPWSKKSEGSYLIGYRYALAGIAQAIGVNIGTSATPSYQDMSFKFNVGNSKLGNISVFGLLSSSTIEIGRSTSNTLYGNGNQVDFGSRIGLLGVNHVKHISKNSFISSTVGVNYSSTDQTGFAVDRNSGASFIKETNNVARTSFNIKSNFHSKINSRLFFKAGIQDEMIGLDLYFKTKNLITENFRQIWNYNGRTNLAQAFAHLKYELTGKLTLNTGIHSQLFFLNNSFSLEPRLGLIYKATDNSSLNFGYGLHAQTQPLNVYFLQSIDSNGKTVYNNRNLDFTKSHHVVIGYNFQPSKDWRLKMESYYQFIFNVPVNTFSSSYSMLNTGSGFRPDIEDNLTNTGTGRNYGIELTIEKFFSKGYYGIFTSSIYNSTYKGSDGTERNTAFNGKYVFNALAGKEWKMGDKKRNRFSVDFKITNAGGRAYTPINLHASNSVGREILSTAAYSDFYGNYYRADIKSGYTLNRENKRVSHSFSLDLQNVTNHKNIFSQQYDNRSMGIRNTYQLGFFPNLLYKLQF